jgi:hypothetical protein
MNIFDFSTRFNKICTGHSSKIAKNKSDFWPNNINILAYTGQLKIFEILCGPLPDWTLMKNTEILSIFKYFEII